jgi:hypothetical protein
MTMAWTIIVASSDGAQLELLHWAAFEIGRELPKGEHCIFEAGSVEEVLRQRKRVSDPQAELLIVAASLIDGRPAVVPAAQPGLSLVAALQAQSTPACILVSQETAHLLQVQSMPRCELLLVYDGVDYIQQCKHLARKLGVRSEQVVPTSAPPEAPDLVRTLDAVTVARSTVPDTVARSQQPPAASDRYAWIDVVMPQSSRSASLRLEVAHPTEPMRPEPLRFRPIDVKDVIRRSRDLTDQLSKALRNQGEWERNRKSWEGKYRALGEQIFRLLWKDDFIQHYTAAKTKVGASNVRIRFTLHRDMLDGLWEAAFNTKNGRYLMLEDTMTRRVVGTPFDVFPMPKDGGDMLRMLVIKSSVPDRSTPKGPQDQLWREYLEDIGSQLDSLEHLDDEVKALRALAKRKHSTSKAGSPSKGKMLSIKIQKRSGLSAKAGSLADDVKKELLAESGRYDVVLFAGHALFARGRKGGDDRGYLVFSGHPNPVAVPIGVVAGWLKSAGVQLVHLSCCRSSAARAATEFAQHGIPMTIGFTWDLDDRKAVDFTREFYTELLNDSRLNVCAAFAAARRHLLKQHESGDPIWASPVLVAQPWDCNHVEGMLRIPKRKLARSKPPMRRKNAPGTPPRQNQAPLLLALKMMAAGTLYLERSEIRYLSPCWTSVGQTEAIRQTGSGHRTDARFVAGAVEFLRSARGSIAQRDGDAVFIAGQRYHFIPIRRWIQCLPQRFGSFSFVRDYERDGATVFVRAFDNPLQRRVVRIAVPTVGGQHIGIGGDCVEKGAGGVTFASMVLHF